ncbi:MAG: SH3 domain-containing protein [Candidatus Omnitrophica bacterium]|nr:SH3 domain-containing protein [Candidatus Omnitrophota bacterium]MDD5441223.1 SH3 domain-containing protein [Candidatus Omnitrophota bacterium]
MKKIIAFLIISLLFICQGFCGQKYYINNDGVNVRVDSTVSAESFGSLPQNTQVEVIKRAYGWAKIVLPEKGFYGYVSEDYVSLDKPNKIKVSADSLNIRADASINAPIIGQVSKDTELIALAKNSGWYKISAYPYICGWVNNKFLSLVAKEDNPVLQRRKAAIELNNKIKNLLNELADANLQQRISARNKLTAMGRRILPELEAYYPVVKPEGVYGLISVISELAKNDVLLAGKYINKVRGDDLLSDAFYLDIAQDILMPDNKNKEPYYYLARERKLTFAQIEKAKQRLIQLNKLKIDDAETKNK